MPVWLPPALVENDPLLSREPFGLGIPPLPLGEGRGRAR